MPWRPGQGKKRDPKKPAAEARRRNGVSGVGERGGEMVAWIDETDSRKQNKNKPEEQSEQGGVGGEGGREKTQLSKGLWESHKMFILLYHEKNQ